MPTRSMLPRAGRRAVVLVHGFFCNRGIWNRWVPHLRAAGVPHLAVTLEPPFDAIENYVATIDAAIERATRAPAWRRCWSCHSMGGLAARAWWQAHAASAASRVHGVITIGSPHHGTFTARLARARQRAPDAPGQCLAAGAGRERGRRSPSPLHLLLQPLRQHLVAGVHRRAARGRQPPPRRAGARGAGLCARGPGRGDAPPRVARPGCPEEEVVR